MSRSSTSIELQPYAATAPVTHFANNDDAPQTTTEDLRPINAPQNDNAAKRIDEPTKGTTAIVLVTVVCVTMISTLLAGLVTVGLPTMAAELDIPPNLLLW
jgi:hypothetical protein